MNGSLRYPTKSAGNREWYEVHDKKLAHDVCVCSCVIFMIIHPSVVLVVVVEDTDLLNTLTRRRLY